MPVVLVFPSCNEPGLEVVESLRHHPAIRLVGASSLDRAVDPGAYLLERHYYLPMLDSPAFEAALASVIEAESVSMVVATVDSVVTRFSRLAASWQGVTFIGPDPSVADVCASKVQTLSRLGALVPVPRAVEPGARAFAKPDQGSGSRGARVLNHDWEWTLAQQEQCVIQELLPGDEYTVDCLGDPSGELVVSSVRRRSVVGRGIALASELVHEPVIDEHVRAIAAELKIAGPWFAQFKRDADGVARLLEVNARVGGSMGSTRLAGINIPLMAVFLFAGQRVQVPALNGVRHVVRRLTYACDMHVPHHVIWDLDDTLVDRQGRPMPLSVAHLLDLDNRGHRQWLMTRNVDPNATLALAHIPLCFEDIIQTTDKESAIEDFLVRNELLPSDVLMVNDSYTERLVHQARWPELRVIGPDLLQSLSWEKV